MSNDLEKIVITPVEGQYKNVDIKAQYNPKELSFSKSVDYSDKDGEGLDYPTLYFTAGKAITISVEFFFDAYEIPGGDVRSGVSSLVSLCLIDPSLKRPPMVRLLWGKTPILGDNAFYGVVSDASVKYTMFRGSVPVRASVTVSVKQADSVGAKASSSDSDYQTKTFLANVTPVTVSQDDDLRNAIIAAGGDPTKPETWPESVEYTSKGSGGSESSDGGTE